MTAMRGIHQLARLEPAGTVPAAGVVERTSTAVHA